MAVDAPDRGSFSWVAVQRLASSVAGVPATLGFVALGAGVLASRALLDAMEHRWSLVSGEDGRAMPRPERHRRTAAEPR